MSLSRLPAPSWLRAAAVVLGLGLMVALGMAMTAPGCLSVDEVTYLLSARSLALGHGVEVWNGYEEMPSPSLAPAWIKVVGGRLVSQYPDYFLFLALPAYRLLGFRGLFLVNVLAFAGVLVLTWRLASRQFDARTAWVAAGLLALATFSWEYAVAAWPHMSAALLTLAPLVLIDAALTTKSERHALGLAALAGLVGGFGIGIRFDVAFSLAALGGVLLLVRPARWREAMALGLGALPALAGLALLNRVKFGLASPFTYGPSYGIATGIGPYVPLAVGGLAAFAILVAVTRRPWRWDGRTRAVLVIGAAAALGAVALVPSLRATAARFVHGAYELIVDLRIRPLDPPEPALVRAPDGGFLYFGSLKKALLQSCPWLVLGLVPLLRGTRDEDRGRALLLLGAVPVALIGIYSFFAWDGGLALNQRYFVPALPMLAILGARGLDVVLRRSAASPLAWGLGGVVPVLAWILLAELAPFDYSRQSLLLLSVPMAVAALLFVAVVGGEAVGGRRPGLAVSTAVLAAAAISLGTLSSLAYDLRRTHAYRHFQANLGEVAAKRAGADALLFSEPAELFAAAVDGTSHVRLANPAKDGYRSFDALARFHVERRPVLLGLFRPRFDDLVTRGVLSGWSLEPLAGNSVVVLVRLHVGAPATTGANGRLAQPGGGAGGGGLGAGAGAASAPTSAPAAIHAPEASRAPA